MYLFLVVIFILLIIALSINKPSLLLCGSFLVPLQSGDMSLQIMCPEWYSVEFMEINRAVTWPPRLWHDTRGTIQLAAPDCQLRHSSSLCMCCSPLCSKVPWVHVSHHQLTLFSDAVQQWISLCYHFWNEGPWLTAAGQEPLQASTGFLPDKPFIFFN